MKRRTRRGGCALLLLCLPLCWLSACGAEPTARHAVLITIDTLRPDRLGAYGYADAETPNLDALASTSVRFERGYAHSSMTVPSMASLFTSLLPREHGIYANGASLGSDLPSLAATLREAGFTTGAFVGSYLLRPARGFARGFDAYTREYVARERTRNQLENPASELTDAAIAWVLATGPEQRLFLWVHYQEPHGPYTPPEFATRETEGAVLPRSATNSGRLAIPRYQWLGHGSLAEYEARYDGEIRVFDRELGRLLAALDEEGILEQSAVVLTSDHGEAFGEDGVYCAHGEGLGENLLHVPLLLRAPGLSPAVRHDRVRLIDVAPTLLALTGVSTARFGGTSLVDEVGDRRLVAQVKGLGSDHWRAVREGSHELVQNEGHDPLLVAGSGAAEAAHAVRSDLAKLLEHEAPWPSDTPEIEILDAERAALRALGYVE